MSSGRAGDVARSTDRPHSETGGGKPVRMSSRAFLRTSDGVAIDAVYEPGAAVHDTSGTPSAHPVFVVAHGFTGAVDRPHVRRIAAAFARHGGVVTFSFRGHGRSGGHSTVGDREVLDLTAAVAWARSHGHARVVTVGFSMGGSVVLRHAALHPRQTDAVVSVSSPARWYYRGTAPMRRLHWLVTRPEGRVVGRYGFRTRIHHRDWNPVPLSPVEAVRRMAPTPLLIVHGDADGYFPVDHPRMLAAAAGDQGELWLEPGMGHAEHAAGDALLARIGEWGAGRAG
ncbi:alpha/beta hydrolase [Streptomyces collinus]|uniref:alpha/beta hydrolase n=1 Tax=Streptomyces collinus TaxID=42684 RepID=UPI00380B7F00